MRNMEMKPAPFEQETHLLNPESQPEFADFGYKVFQNHMNNPRPVGFWKIWVLTIKLLTN